MQRQTQHALQCGLAGVALGFTARWLRDNFTGYSFRDRVVVVTGGSRGLGLVLARQLAKAGARIAICARAHEELARAGHELRRMGATVFAGVCDVTQPQQIEAFLDSVGRELGPIDVLINNAGTIQVGPLQSMTIEDFEHALQVHFWAVVHAVNYVLPAMRRRQAGRIVNIASIGGQVAIPHLLPYSASKFALVGYSHGLGIELAADGIVVTTVCPGLMRTGSARNASFKGKHREEYAWFSIGGSLPGVTIGAESAARQVLDACRHGRSRITLSIPAKVAVALNSLAPRTTAWLAQAVNTLLPAAGGIGTQQRKGSESTSQWSPSWITTLNEQAAHENNEQPWSARARR